jgi:hypothetical protein
MSARHRASTRSSRLSTSTPSSQTPNSLAGSKIGQAQGRARQTSLSNQRSGLAPTTTPTTAPFSPAGPSASLNPDLRNDLPQEEYPLGPTTTPASAPYSLTGPTGTQTRPFSLAGGTATRIHSKRDDRTSFISEGYWRHNPDHGKWSDEPIFALSKPFPRVMRPGMREKMPTHEDQRPSTDSTETGQHARDRTSDTAAVITNTSQPEPHNLGTAAVEDNDILRKATTANFSSYLPENLQTREKELEEEQISAHDKAHSSGSLQTQSRNAVSAARKRLQDIADAAVNESGVRLPQNLDWEEYHQRPPPEYLHPYQTSADAPSDLPHFFNSWGPIRYKLRKPFAEFLGTIVYMTIGLCGSITHMASAPSTDNASLLMAYIAWGFGVMVAIYIAGGVSGAHLNPTISIMLAIFRGFPWHDCWQYIIAQLLGSITASGIAYGLYRDAIAQYTRSKSISQAGPAFWTKPRDGLSNVSRLHPSAICIAVSDRGFNSFSDGRVFQ